MGCNFKDNTYFNRTSGSKVTILQRVGLLKNTRKSRFLANAVDGEDDRHGVPRK